MSGRHGTADGQPCVPAVGRAVPRRGAVTDFFTALADECRTLTSDDAHVYTDRPWAAVERRNALLERCEVALREAAARQALFCELLEAAEAYWMEYGDNPDLDRRLREVFAKARG